MPDADSLDDNLHRFTRPMKRLLPTAGKGFDIRQPRQLSVGVERHVMVPGTGLW
jgi:hypothetical protein